jgi:HPt (histidine-containing phosphotransfer) domain-containing protein
MTKIRLEYLNELCAGDMNFISEMLKTYIDETGKELRHLKEDFEQKNREGIYFLAHKLKTSFQMLGLDQLRQNTMLLEQKTKSKDCSFEELEEIFQFIIENGEKSLKQAQRLIEDL